MTPQAAHGMIEHEFHAVAFAENFSLKELAAAFGEPALAAFGRPIQDFRRPLGEGEAFYFSFGGVLVVDRLTPERTGIVALTVAQSAAVEYYERIVDSMFERTAALVDRLERTGTVAMSVRPLHRFIGEAVGARSEVIAVLHLLDKPDATWDDPAMDAIYDDLRDEFDLVDRHDEILLSFVRPH